MSLYTFSHNKKNQDGLSKCPCLTLSQVNVTLDAKILLVPTHQLIAPSTLLAPATNIDPNIQGHKDTYTQTTDIWAIFSKYLKKSDNDSIQWLCRRLISLRYLYNLNTLNGLCKNHNLLCCTFINVNHSLLPQWSPSTCKFCFFLLDF